MSQQTIDGAAFKVSRNGQIEKQPARRNSLLKSKSNYDFSVSIDGFEIYCRELTHDVQDLVDTWPERAANILGCDIETLADPAAVRDIAVKFPQRQTEFKRAQLDLWEQVIDRCVVGWSDEEPCTSENKLDLPTSIKRRLYDRISGASAFGLDEQDFTRSF